MAQVKPGNLGHLPPDREERIQRGHGVLEDHRDPVSADRRQPGLAHLQQVFSAEQGSSGDHAARRLGHQPHHRQVGHRFTRSRLAHNPQCLAGGNRKRHPVHRPDQAVVGLEPDFQVFNFQQRLGHGVLGSSQWAVGSWS